MKKQTKDLAVAQNHLFLLYEKTYVSERKHLFVLWEETDVFVNSCYESGVLILMEAYVPETSASWETCAWSDQLFWLYRETCVCIVRGISCLYCERKHLFCEKQLFEGKEQLLWVIPYGFGPKETDVCWLLVTWPDIIKAMISNVILYTWKR